MISQKAEPYKHLSTAEMERCRLWEMFPSDPGGREIEGRNDWSQVVTNLSKPRGATTHYFALADELGVELAAV